MKYKIEKNTVQETLIIPLYARKVCSELYPSLYRDETSIRLLDEIGSPATMAMAGPRFFGFVIGGALPAALLN